MLLLFSLNATKKATKTFMFQIFHFYKILHTDRETYFLKYPKNCRKKKCWSGNKWLYVLWTWSNPKWQLHKIMPMCFLRGLTMPSLSWLTFLMKFDMYHTKTLHLRPAIFRKRWNDFNLIKILLFNDTNLCIMWQFHFRTWETVFSFWSHIPFNFHLFRIIKLIEFYCLCSSLGVTEHFKLGGHKICWP